MNRLSGHDIKSQIDRRFFYELLTQYAANSPEGAVKRIFDAFGVVPTISGNNIYAIKEIREFVFDQFQDRCLANSLLLVAPHTHWPPQLPVIYSWAQSSYRVGPAPIKLDECYTPVSFVFSEQGALPYEFVDSSVSLDFGFAQKLFEVVRAINDRFASQSWPIGIAIDFRFRDLLSTYKHETLEFDNKEEYIGDMRMSSIVLVDKNLEEKTAGALQLGWHCMSSRFFNLPQHILPFVIRGEQMLNELSCHDARRERIEEIERALDGA